MTSASVAPLAVMLIVCAVLLLSGTIKLRDRRATRDAFTALRVPTLVPARASAAALPWLEIVLAVLLPLSPAEVAWLPAVAVLLLMLAYTGLVARALRFEEPVACSCFGSIGNPEVGARTLGRNVLLTALAFVVLWYVVDGGSGPSAVRAMGEADWSVLLAGAAAVAVALLVAAPASSEPVTGRAGSDDEPLDYERRPIPYGVLTHLDGTSLTLAEMASTQARFLFFLSIHCGSCVRIAGRLDAWTDRLAPAVGVLAVYAKQDAAEQAGHRKELSTWEPEKNVRRVLALAGTPSAVLLGADGLLAGGPVIGEDAVVELVEAVLEQIDALPTEDPVV